MISRIRRLLVASMVLSSLCTACLQQPNGSVNKSPAPTTSGPSSDSAPQPSAPGRSAMGTSSGGGANGVDNKTLEVFAVKIETLPEYRKYIAPILTRMSRGNPDILLGYFNWAISHKAWLFVPAEFDTLSKEQVGISFASDQLARNYPKEVHINAKRYGDKSGREKANLLLHEIVMSARFLMKQTPQVQCAALNQGNEKQCSSREMLKLAKARDLDEKARQSLDNYDHEAVRSLTVYLMSKDQDLSGATISRVRRNLGFDFPWDQLSSSLTLSHLIDAIKRSELAGDKWIASGVEQWVSDKPLECFPTVDNYRFESAFLSVNYLLPVDMENSFTAYGTVTRFNGNKAETRRSIQPTFIWTNDDGIEARGTLDPNDESRMIDVVRVLPDMNFYAAWRPNFEEAFILEYHLTRDATPRLIEIRTIPVRVMTREAVEDGQSKQELVPIRTEPTICRLQN